ncbi:unnamed protein product (macronuclear) [Paramecium tetraurelia]|uniref:Uncharacterized protein n=1 Tax=Paramecium tetraurelia TaxID=5888 RepID=A0BET7_PARTE|nr:uncharacterized protein GSPATT00028087001 [Paramecium tetraurelia]CAK57054.1 unnamed protein product [Paramecium tetraurelia]|eukprot:XP_001424452.1 hypothetical protein (macronuclear) [Paramecium tetraurelia strain d4-2]
MLDQRQTLSDINRLRNTPYIYYKQYQSIDNNQQYDTKQVKMIARPNVRYQMIHENLSKLQQDQKKLRQSSQQRERTKTQSNYRAFSLNQKAPSNSRSQPDLTDDNQSVFVPYRQRNISQNSISISYDNSEKKKSFLPTMNNKDPMLQTFGKQVIILKPKRFPTEIFQGNVSKMKKQFQQNY